MGLTSSWQDENPNLNRLKCIRFWVWCPVESQRETERGKERERWKRARPIFCDVTRAVRDSCFCRRCLKCVIIAAVHLCLLITNNCACGEHSARALAERLTVMKSGLFQSPLLTVISWWPSSVMFFQSDQSIHFLQTHLNGVILRWLVSCWGLIISAAGWRSQSLWMLGSGHHSSYCFSVKLSIERLFAELVGRSTALENHTFATLSLTSWCIHTCVHHSGDVARTRNIESVRVQSRSSCWQVSLMNK